MRRPPIREPFVFIQAGGLHGLAMICSRGFSALAWRSNGRICAWSCLTENSR
jgi:hypothetical protein